MYSMYECMRNLCPGGRISLVCTTGGKFDLAAEETRNARSLARTKMCSFTVSKCSRYFSVV